MKSHTRLFTIILLCLITGNIQSVLAQGPGQGRGMGNQERIQSERIAFFTEQLQLTPGEAKDFWPVYNDYNSRKELLNDERRMLMRFVNSNIDNMEKKEIEEQLEKLVKIENRSHQLFVEYNDKFLEVLPPAKVMRLYIAENRFKQYLLQRLGDARRQRQGGGRFNN